MIDLNNQLLTVQKTDCISFTKTLVLRHFRKVIAIYSKNNTNPLI